MCVIINSLKIKTKHLFFLIQKNKYHNFFYLYSLVLRFFFILNAKYLFMTLPCNIFICKFKLLVRSQSKWVFILLCYFLYNKIVSVIPLKKFSFFFLPLKKQLFILSRAPFVFKKSKEHFTIDLFKVIIYLNIMKINLVSLHYLNRLLNFIDIYIPIKWSLLLHS